MKFLFIEPFYIGSHALFADGLAEHSVHDIDVLKMPGENFRWRMVGSAVYWAQQVDHLDDYDGVIVSDMFNLADFKALTDRRSPPVMAYFHENQLTYPRPGKDRSALMLGMINISTALAADRVVFNSFTHCNAFLSAVPDFLNRGKDFRPAGVVEKIKNKSRVLYPGITLPVPMDIRIPEHRQPPLIIWNHRWGYDKNFTLFLRALEDIKTMGFDFRLAIMGENFGMIPDEFLEAKNRFSDQIVRFGYVASRDEYIDLLKQGSIVVSTALQENFGMSVIEAMICGCIPLLPDRLAYPEILPKEFHDLFLYKNGHELANKLSNILKDISDYDEIRKQLAGKMEALLWENVVADYDSMLRELAGA